MNTDPPDDPEELFREILNRMHAEALVTPTVLTLPPKVIESITSYQKTHGIPRENLLDLALISQKADCLIKTTERLIKDPDAFTRGWYPAFRHDAEGLAA